MSDVLAFLASHQSASGARCLSLSDRAAVAWATRMNAHATAVCAHGDVAAAEYALAAGCRLMPFATAAEVLPFDRAAIGNGLLERFGDEFAARLAERQSASLVFDVLSCVVAANGTMTVVRDAGRGARDVLTITGPVVLVVSPAAARPDYVSRFRRLKSRKELAATEATIIPDEDWHPVRPRTRRAMSTIEHTTLDGRMDMAFGMAPATMKHSGAPIVADARTCAQHLLRYLAHYGFVQRPPGAEGTLTTTVAPSDNAPKVAHDGATVRDDSQPTLLHGAAVRRPRLPHDSANRRQRQPRLIGTTVVTSLREQACDRRPRRSGQPRRNDRGPRRVVPAPPVT